MGRAPSCAPEELELRQTPLDARRRRHDTKLDEKRIETNCCQKTTSRHTQLLGQTLWRAPLNLVQLEVMALTGRNIVININWLHHVRKVESAKQARPSEAAVRGTLTAS